MDRFIDISVTVFMCLNVDLKSNMDRFIAIAIVASIAVVIFKIQYGQIYSEARAKLDLSNREFKIQYGQIYSIRRKLRLYKEFLFKIQYGQIYR